MSVSSTNQFQPGQIVQLTRRQSSKPSQYFEYLRTLENGAVIGRPLMAVRSTDPFNQFSVVG